jgi:TetR/AcrR family transcriptional regulator
MDATERRTHARERDAETTRETILNAGQRVFAQRGFSGARIDDIAEVAGYNKALIFHYFGDKLGLYRAVMSRTKGRIIEQLATAIERFALDGDAPPSREQVASFVAESIRWVYDYLIENRETASIMAWEAAEGWQTFSSCAPLEGENLWTKYVRPFLRRAQEAGVLRRELDPELLIATVMSLPLIHLVSLPRHEVLFPDTDFSSPAALLRAREQLIALALHGALASPEEA